MYLAAVVDLGRRKVVGWSMDTTMKQGLVINALKPSNLAGEASPGFDTPFSTGEVSTQATPIKNCSKSVDSLPV